MYRKYVILVDDKSIASVKGIGILIVGMRCVRLSYTWLLITGMEILGCKNSRVFIL